MINKEKKYWVHDSTTSLIWLNKLLNTLGVEIDKKIGLVFLTLDDHATQVPQYLKSVKEPLEYFTERAVSIEIKNQTANFLLQLEDVQHLYARTQLQNTTFNLGIVVLVQKDFNLKKRIDDSYTLNPAVISCSKTGLSHRSSFVYDIHMPLTFYGMECYKRTICQKTLVVDIAPVSILQIVLAKNITRNVINEVVD
ncbi:hypothetical protein ACSTS3_13945 [Aquimarina muelleri]|uniref:hypothetical protein n=1 Tax=Aquimarina muelleri TaxID=279356 RepID=UPI003F68680D